MSEIQKHIESCRAEDPLAQTMEACGNESDLQAALQPLLVETMPGYEPVPTTAPTSPIAELPNVLISIIRRVATKPLTMFGERPAKQSLLGTLLDTWNAIRQRLAGNPSAGIPDRRADMSAHSLPTALAILNDRKISGVPEAEDGMSMARILMDKNLGVTELQDDNSEWLPKSINLTSIFPNLTKVTLGFKELVFADNVYPGVLFTSPLKSINMPGVKHIRMVYGGGGGSGVFYNLPEGSEIIAPDCEKIESYGGGYPVLMHSMQGVVKIVLGKLTSFSMFANSTNAISLIHFEIGEGTAISLDFSKWSPTNALDASSTDLVADPVAHPTWTNLQQFLLNFREFIALRLANRKDTTALTLTLSAAVYNAVTGADSGWASLHTLAELGITTDDLTELEQELGITTATLYSTWLDTYTGANGIHWNVNKAN